MYAYNPCIYLLEIKSKTYVSIVLINYRFKVPNNTYLEIEQ